MQVIPAAFGERILMVKVRFIRPRKTTVRPPRIHVLRTLSSILATLVTLTLAGCATCPDSTTVLSSSAATIPNTTMAWCRMDPDKIQSCTMNNKGNWDCQPFRGNGPVTEVPGRRVK